MSNSLESLLARMREGTVTQGWGAVCAFSRARLNRLLEQQYIERFQRMSFLPDFIGDTALDEQHIETANLARIELGPPLLSFLPATLTTSTARVTMNILAGQYRARHRGAGVAETLTSSFNITEQMGLRLELDIDLSVIEGEVDRQGKVTLDLSRGVRFRCNLLGDDTDDPENQRLAGFFQHEFESLPADRSVFELGMLGLKGYNALTPRSFRVLTQAAPGAKVRGAKNAGDGAVVVFIQLRINAQPGTFPPVGDFPYLIPDDDPERYSTSLVVSQDLQSYFDNVSLDVLNNLLFPGAQKFYETERHTPRDLAVFGAIIPSQTSFTVEPLFKTIMAGESQPFTLLNWQGEVIAAQEWQAVGLQSHQSESEGSIAGDGIYHAASPLDIGRDTLTVIVTAIYTQAGTTYSASAMLTVVFDGMQLLPSVAARSGGRLAQPVALRASTLQGSALTWSRVGPQYGELSEVGNGAVFTPDERAGKKALLVQQVQAQGAERKTACVLLINGQQMSRIDPAHVPRLGKSESVLLEDDSTLLPGLERRWKVLAGGGSIEKDTSRFTAPADSTGSSSIVSCEVVRNGVVFSSGYSVIDLSELKVAPPWTTLSLFTVKVPGGPDQGRAGSLLPNGYQQLIVKIKTQTMSVDGVTTSLSPTERASMRLVSERSNQYIPKLDPTLEGMPEGDLERWRVRNQHNRFELAAVQPMSHQASLQLLPFKARADSDVSLQDFYLHSRADANEVITVHATFKKDDSNTWLVSYKLNTDDGRINVTPRSIPQFDHTDYDFTVQRAHGNGNDPTVEPPAENAEDPPFDLHFRTVDYWTLSFKPYGTQGYVPFETLEFLPENDADIYMTTNTSMILWESEQLAETFFSWTGYIFNDPLLEEDLSKVNFDPAVKDVVPAVVSLNIPVGPLFTSGKLVISLHRDERVPYIPSGGRSRDKLSTDLRVVLIDKQGNTHKRRISFLYEGQVGRRNRLQHTPLQERSNTSKRR